MTVKNPSVQAPICSPRNRREVPHNKDTGTLFIVGDGGTAVARVSTKGGLINPMTLAPGATKPQGIYFYDPEGITYLGNGKFALRGNVIAESTNLPMLTHAAGTTLGASGSRAAKIGTTVGNIGIEDLSFDPSTSGFVMVKEFPPSGGFQTTVDFAAGVASNGSAPTTSKSAVGVGSNPHLTFNIRVIAGTGSIVLSNGAGDIPPVLVSASAYQTFPLDNAKYNGSLDRNDLAVFASRVRAV